MAEAGPPRTQDIDIRTASSPLWNRSLDNLQRVLDDPDDPDHDVATNIVRLTFAPVKDALAKQTSSISEQLVKAMSPLRVDVGAVFAEPEPRRGLSPGIPGMLRAFEDLPAASLDLVRSARTPAQLRTGVEEATSEWRAQMLRLQTERIEQADAHATQQSAESTTSRKLAIWGVVGGWMAALAAIATLVAMLLQPTG